MLENNLRILMAKQKINSVAALSRISEVGPKPIHCLYKEDNVGSVKLESLLKICDALGCSLSELINYNPTEKYK